MAKSGTPRHSKPTRKPVTIEHDPAPKPQTGDAVNPKPHPHEAEPVGDFSKAKTTRSGAPKAEAFKPSAAKSSSSKDAGSVSQTNMSSSKMQADPKPQTNASAEAPKPAAVKSARTGSNLVAGIAGGVIALAGAAALQWSNVIPVAGTQVTTEQLTQLQQEISALKTAPVPAQPDQAVQQKIEQAASLAQATSAKLDEHATLTTTKLADLQKQIDNQPASVSSNLDVDIDQLSAKIAALETQLTAASSKADTAVADVSADQNTITQLQHQFSALQEKITENTRQPDISALIAANALKNAIDRGGSYVSELETFTSVQPSDPANEILTQHASTGIPTMAELNTRFNPVADKIVATVNKPAPDASLWEHLKASAKGLVSIRPVGDVAGTGVGPITARMEKAVNTGDLERAINEWEQLPADAKAVSQDFADQIKLRRDTDQLLARLMAQSLQSKPDADAPQAAQ